MNDDEPDEKKSRLEQALQAVKSIEWTVDGRVVIRDSDGQPLGFYNPDTHELFDTQDNLVGMGSAFSVLGRRL